MLAEKPTQPKTLSQKALDRKSTKPIMEKRRRARINNSLSELKNLILDALKKDTSRHSKLEKADILEMTVKYLQNLQRQQINGDPNSLIKFRAGFSECANEVSRYLAQYSESNQVDSTLRIRILSHLANCIQTTPNPTLTQSTNGHIYPVNIEVPSLASSSSSLNNTNHIFNKGVPLVPTRLPTGEIAFLLPQTNINGQIEDHHSPISPCTSTSPQFSLSQRSLINVLGSAGILSPASSDRSCSSPQSAATTSSSSSHFHFNNFAPIKHESDDSRVWRPW